MGGVWERLIRVIRKVLAGMFDINCRMSDEMFETVLSEVEAVINGRPITKVSDDLKDENALTPNHLLLLGSGCSFPPGVFCSCESVMTPKMKMLLHRIICYCLGVVVLSHLVFFAVMICTGENGNLCNIWLIVSGNAGLRVMSLNYKGGQSGCYHKEIL